MEMKPCPFCGCAMTIYVGKYPNGDKRIEPYGYHCDNCILNAVSWHTYPEDGWNEEKIIKAWNKRKGNSE